MSSISTGIDPAAKYQRLSVEYVKVIFKLNIVDFLVRLILFFNKWNCLKGFIYLFRLGIKFLFWNRHSSKNKPKRLNYNVKSLPGILNWGKQKANVTLLHSEMINLWNELRVYKKVWKLNFQFLNRPKGKRFLFS